MLKSQLEWDSAQLRLSAEKADLKRQVEQLTNENEEIRRALKKLLELVSVQSFTESPYSLSLSLSSLSLPPSLPPSLQTEGDPVAACR